MPCDVAADEGDAVVVDEVVVVVAADFGGGDRDAADVGPGEPRRAIGEHRKLQLARVAKLVAHADLLARLAAA